MSQPERGITHGLKLNARTLVPLVADTGRSCWIVGTNALRDENEVRLLMQQLPALRAALQNFRIVSMAGREAALLMSSCRPIVVAEDFLTTRRAAASAGV